jgi:hypothetical protein
MKIGEISENEWSEKTDKSLAEKYGGTRQKYSAFRNAHGKPASPVGHGGFRHGIQRDLVKINVPREKAAVLKKLAARSLAELARL